MSDESGHGRSEAEREAERAAAEAEREAAAEAAAEAEDRRLLAELAAALGPDRLPAGLVARSEGLLPWMELEHDLAALLDETHALAGTRGPATESTLSFAVEDGSITLSVEVTEDRITGHVLSGAPAEVVLERVDRRTETASVDDLGRFTFSPVAAGLARLRLGGGSQPPVVTDWFVV